MNNSAFPLAPALLLVLIAGLIATGSLRFIATSHPATEPVIVSLASDSPSTSLPLFPGQPTTP